jgi:hypothetical protein
MGNNNVFASKLSNDFSIMETTQLTFTTEVKSHLVLSNGGNLFFLGWIENQKAWISTIETSNTHFTLNETFVIDSGMINDYKLAASVAYFQKIKNDSLHVFARERKYQTGVGWYWDELFAVDTTGNNIDLEVCSGWEYLETNEALWVKNNVIQLYSEHNTPQIHQFNTYDLTSVHKPGNVMWFWMVKGMYDQPHILVYSTGLENESEIYSSFGDYGTEFDTVFVTKNNVPDRNPKVFWGEPTEPYSNWVYAVWESHRNDHVSLYYSKIKAYIGSGIDENNAGTISLNVNPNPFDKHLEINIVSTKKAEVNLSAFSLSGKAVWQKTVQISDQEIHTYDWKPGKQIPKGMYLIVAEQKGVIVSKRVVYR